MRFDSFGTIGSLFTGEDTQTIDLEIPYRDRRRRLPLEVEFRAAIYEIGYRFEGARRIPA